MANVERVNRLLRRRFKCRQLESLPWSCPRGGRKRLAEVFNELGYKRGVEIGTMEGDYAQTLCQCVAELQLTCVDPYKAYDRHSQAGMEVHRTRAEEKVNQYGVQFLRMRSVDAINQFEDRSLDFVYIDGSHDFDDVMCDLIFYSKKVKIGGILAGHDYYLFPGVTIAVDAYVSAHKIDPWYVIIEGAFSFCWVVAK